MKRLEVNPNNEKYYTKDFISGFRCGTKRQLESDLTILNKIRAEIGKSKTEHEMQITEKDRKAKLLISDIYCDIVNILDKYKTESEEV